MDRVLTANELNTFRSRPQRARWYLAVHRPASIFASVIANTPIAWPASALNIYTASNLGSPASVVKNMTAWIGTLPGASDEGKIRVRSFSPAASTIYIAESGSGIARYYAGKYVTVMDEFYPWPKHPRFDTAASKWLMDYSEAYTDQLDNYGPVIVMGPPLAGIMSAGSLSASFVGEKTQFISATQSAQTWTMPDGGDTDTDLGTEASPVTRLFTTASPSGRYFSLAATDSTGTSAISRRLAFVFADDTGPARVQYAAITGGLREGGYSANITAYSGADTDSFPDGAEVVIFEQASYAGQASALGGNYPFRNNVVFRGWIMGETVQMNPFYGIVTFQAKTINQLMTQMPSYDVFMTDSNAPSQFTPWTDKITGTSQWVRAAALSVDRAAINVIKHRSTISEVTDFRLSSGTLMTENTMFQDLPRGTIWDQLEANYNGKGMLGILAADLHSTLWGTHNAHIQGTSAALPINMVVEKRDRADNIQVSHKHHDLSARVEIYGVKYYPSGSSWHKETRNYIPYGAESPGNVDAYYGGRQSHPRGLVVTSQHDMTTWAGNWRAVINNPYPDTIVPLSGYIKADVVPQHRVQMTLSATDVYNVRGIDWDNQDFIPHTMSLEYDQERGYAKTILQLEKTVDGKGGSAITFPFNIYPINPPNPPTPPAPNLTGNILLFNSQLGAYKWASSAQSWFKANGTLATSGTNVQDFSGG